MRSDGINPGLLGMSKVVSEDSVWRALAKLEEAKMGPVAGAAPASCLCAAARLAVDSGCRCHRQAVVRPPGGGGIGLQPVQAGAPLACDRNES